MSGRLHLVVRAGICVLLVSCAPPENGAGAVASIALAPAGGGPALLTAIGATLALQASPRDSAGNAVVAVVAWSSDAPTVATVNGSGLVTAVSNGRAVISATVL